MDVEKTLKDAIKYFILLSLKEKPMSAKEIAGNCSATLPEISAGLKELRKEGKVEMIKVGKNYPYTLKESV